MDAQRAVDGGADGARRKEIAVERRCEAQSGDEKLSQAFAIVKEHRRTGGG